VKDRVQGTGARVKATVHSSQSTVDSIEKMSLHSSFASWFKGLGVRGADVKSYEEVSKTPILPYSITEVTRYA
jgi:hypothetical protein